MAIPKRDPKTGRFLKKRNGKGVVNRRKRKARSSGGLKGHKPGCRCVIHARRARKARNASRRVRAARPKRARARSVSRTVKVSIKLSTAEAKSYRKGSPGIRAKVERKGKALARQHGGAVRVQSPSGKTLAVIR